MMICRNCNKKNDANALFCYHCGQPLRSNEPSVNPEDVTVSASGSYSQPYSGDMPTVGVPTEYSANEEVTQSFEGSFFPNQTPAVNNQGYPQGADPSRRQPGYSVDPTDATQSAETSYRPPQYIQQPQNYPQYNAQPAKQNISLKIVIIAGISVVAVALMIFALILYGNMNKTGDDEASSGSKTASSVSGNDPTAEPIESKLEFDNITVENSSFMSDEELNELQGSLEAKTDAIGHTVYVCLMSEPSGGAQKYADSNCKKKAGGDGILIVVDGKNHKAGISAIGKGKEHVTDTAKKKLISQTADMISSGDYSDGVDTIITKIPENYNEAEALKFDPVSDSKQVVYVKKNSGSTSASLTYVDYTEARPIVALKCDAYVGNNGITDDPQEGLSATPKGKYKLGMVLTTNSVTTNMNIEPVNSGDIWITDPNSAYYNTKQGGNAAGDWNSSDPIYNNFASGKFYACILIEHNGNGYQKGEYNKGSGIYLTGKSSDLSTSWGDVNIYKDDMDSLLSMLDKNENPYIVIS